MITKRMRRDGVWYIGRGEGGHPGVERVYAFFNMNNPRTSITKELTPSSLSGILVSSRATIIDLA
ncbi:Hypothetical protein PHPALM_19823 [Phytophthora palmivora]|uniref:Uncharacterized protein n=1 Tax=Phytophthora palmivora TaxID=4796 RepID=A0A2P4XGG9_9STRA|nr:Hypothetical protein PHPALM_19823 [Phytophthora palmivora]